MTIRTPYGGLQNGTGTAPTSRGARTRRPVSLALLCLLLAAPPLLAQEEGLRPEDLRARADELRTRAAELAERALLLTLGQSRPQEIRARAEEGHADDQFSLGRLYEAGNGVARDVEEAVRWYRLAAEQGHAGAQSALGNLYTLGEGVPVDHREALRWLLPAAAQGEAWAQLSLGMLYSDAVDSADYGVPGNHRKAAHWIQMAAFNGLEQATEVLSTMYRFGRLAEVGLPLPYRVDSNFVAAKPAAHLHADFSARETSKVATVWSSRDLLETGFIPIGIVAAQQVSQHCPSAAAEDCETKAHQDPTEMVLEEAAKVGGDLVRLVVDRLETRQVLSTGEQCVEWGRRFMGYTTICSFGVGGYCVQQPRSTSVCNRYIEVVTSTTVFVGSAGTIWRHEPDLAAQQLPSFDLVLAAEANDVGRSRELLEGGLSPSSTSFDPDAGEIRSPLHVAAGRGHDELVTLLLSKGAPAATLDSNGQTAFRLALRGHYIELATTLLEAGGVGEANGDDVTAATEAGAASILSTLLARGADANSQDEDGWTALRTAIAQKNIEIVELLLENGANADLGADDPGPTPLQMALNPYGEEAGGEEAVEIVRILLENGASETKNKFGTTPLHWAAEYSDPRFVQLFIDHAFDLEAKGVLGETPLEKALSEKRTQNVALLIEAGANVNAVDNNGTPALMTAVFYLDIESIRLLLEGGADPNAKNKYRNTPAKMAKKGAKRADGDAKARLEEVIRLFKQYGR